jgi:hypothetical protein
MENKPGKPIIDPRIGIYTEHAVWFCSLIGGPLAAGYIIAENFRVLNRPVKRRRTWWIIVAETLLIVLMTLIFDFEIAVINAISTVLIFLCFHIFQGKEVDEYLAAGGLVVNPLWAFLVAIEGLFGSFLLLYFSEYLYTHIPVWFIPGRY